MKYQKIIKFLHNTLNRTWNFKIRNFLEINDNS